MKGMIPIPQDLYLRIIAILEDYKQSHLNGGDSNNMHEVRRVRRTIRELRGAYLASR